MVELTMMDDLYQVIGFIGKFTSLIWTRRYYDIGDFELHTALKNFGILKRTKYIWSSAFSEVGVVDEYGYKQDDGTAYCKGRFLESLLTDRVVDYYSTAYQNDTPENLARRMVQKIAIKPDDSDREIPGLRLSDELLGGGGKVYFEPRGKGLWDACIQVLKPAELSARIRYDHTTTYKYFEIWQGKNRTVDQAENSLAIFSSGFGNIRSAAYAYNDRDYKNYAYVAGEGEGNARIVVPVDNSNGREPYREIWVDARDLQKKELSDAEYKKLLTQRGLEKLAEYQKSEILDGKARSGGGLIYKKDYDLGDLCTYIDDNTGVTANLRITEITETFENGAHTITPVFGEDTKTIMQKIRRSAI